MLIQWFPGHMTKALRQTEEDIKLCDGVIYVIDARAPFACFNKKLESLFKNKPVIYCINKCDMITAKDCQRIGLSFKQKGLNYELISGLSKKDTEKLKLAMNAVMADKIERNRQKGVKRTLRFIVAGIPNTGKSTIINTICGNKRAETGDKAGVTRSNKWIRLGDFDLLDTPGTTPPSFENQTYARHLAYIGCINDDILDVEELALELIKDLKAIIGDEFKSKYKLDNLEKTDLEIFDEICKKRGFIMKGGEVDYTRCAKAIIDDLRKLRIGKVCFE